MQSFHALKSPPAMNSGHNVSGSQSQPGHLYYSSRETIYSPSLMGSMLSSSDLNLPETTIHNPPENDEQIGSQGGRFVESRPTGCNNQTLQKTIRLEGQGGVSLDLIGHVTPNEERSFSEKQNGSSHKANTLNSYLREVRGPTTVDTNKTATPWANIEDDENRNKGTLSRRSVIVLIISAALVGIMSLGSTILLLVHILSHSTPMPQG